MFEEGEKIFLPDGKSSEEVSGIVKYIFDPDTKNLEVALDKLRFIIPWDRQLLFINSNKSFKQTNLPPEEFGALLRRFDVTINYEKASAAALQSAYEGAFNATLKLWPDYEGSKSTYDEKSRKIRQFFSSHGIENRIISFNQPNFLITPELVRRVTATLVHTLFAELKDVDADDIENTIVPRDLASRIDEIWGAIVSEFSPPVMQMEGATAPPSQISPMQDDKLSSASVPPPPPPRAVRIQPIPAAFKRSRRVLETSRDAYLNLCNEELDKCISSLKNADKSPTLHCDEGSRLRRQLGMSCVTAVDGHGHRSTAVVLLADCAKKAGDAPDGACRGLPECSGPKHLRKCNQA